LQAGGQQQQQKVEEVFHEFNFYKVTVYKITSSYVGLLAG